MHRKLCLMHANCQGEELAALLAASPAFASAYRLVLRTNYTHEPVSAEELSACDVFLYQFLGSQWAELSSASLLSGLSSSALALQIPNMLFKGYWPFWTAQSPIDFGDSLLDRLINEGAPKAAIMKIYLRGTLSSFADLAALFEETIMYEREKEKNCCVSTVECLLAHWKQRMMFLTVNHPGKDLLVHTAQGILDALHLPPLRERELSRLSATGEFPSYCDFELPIHPQAAAFHGLRFGGPEQTYKIFSRRMTFAEYVSRYIDCRLNNLDNEFLAFLQLA